MAAGRNSTELGGIKRITIYEKKNGVCLHEQTIKWEPSSQHNDVCPLGQVFFQLAREIDTGEVTRVVFGDYAPARSHTPSLMSPTQQRLDKSRKMTETKQELDMLVETSPDESVAIMVFHQLKDKDQDALREFAKQLTIEFCRLYSSKLTSLATKLKEISEKGGGKDPSVMEQFRAFENAVGEMYTRSRLRN